MTSREVAGQTAAFSAPHDARGRNLVCRGAVA